MANAGGIKTRPEYLSVGTVYKFHYPPIGSSLFGVLENVHKQSDRALFRLLGRSQQVVDAEEDVAPPRRVRQQITGTTFYNVSREDLLPLAQREQLRFDALRENPDTPAEELVRQEQALVEIDRLLVELERVPKRRLVMGRYYKLVGALGTQICLLWRENSFGQLSFVNNLLPGMGTSVRYEDVYIFKVSPYDFPRGDGDQLEAARGYLKIKLGEMGSKAATAESEVKAKAERSATEIERYLATGSWYTPEEEEAAGGRRSSRKSRKSRKGRKSRKSRRSTKN